MARREVESSALMYLSQLKLKHFRSCYETTVDFRPSITLLVGENNAGKSNIIQAIQLVTSPLSGRRTRYFEESDLSAGRRDQTVELSLKLADLTQAQQGHYLPALDLVDNTARYTARGAIDPRGSRFSRLTFFAGPHSGTDSEPEQREKIRHVYLAPLRDAQRELNSSDGQRLAQVIEYLFSKPERDAFIEYANKHLDDLETHQIITKTAEEIQAHLDQLTEPVRLQGVGIDFRDHELRRLARSLRMKLSEKGIAPADLADSGLGYANLLYIATVILELRNSIDAELTLFLVEEPEAHLHPQLQAILLCYLKEQAEESAKRDDSKRPAGRVQIICTTHSPNLASSVGIENVVVLRTLPQSSDSDLDTNPESPAGQLRPATHAIPISSLNIGQVYLSKISRYLDVTKAALLFARRVLLVEGVAETLLFPTFVRSCLYSKTTGELSETHQRMRRNFSAVTLISVDGVDFKPYIQLLLTKVGQCSILDKLVIVTDGDPLLPELKKSKAEDPPLVTDELEACVDEEYEVAGNRKPLLEATALALGAGTRLKVFQSRYTFEADLLINSLNRPVLKAAYLEQHPRSKHHWEKIENASEPARDLYIKLRENSKFLGKGEFAYSVMFAIESGIPFECPPYIADALAEVLSDE